MHDFSIVEKSSKKQVKRQTCFEKQYLTTEENI